MNIHKAIIYGRHYDYANHMQVTTAVDCTGIRDSYCKRHDHQPVCKPELWAHHDGELVGAWHLRDLLDQMRDHWATKKQNVDLPNWMYEDNEDWVYALDVYSDLAIMYNQHVLARCKIIDSSVYYNQIAYADGLRTNYLDVVPVTDVDDVNNKVYLVWSNGEWRFSPLEDTDEWGLNTVVRTLVYNWKNNNYPIDVPTWMEDILA